MRNLSRVSSRLGALGFFGFFGYFFWGLLGREKMDERLLENIREADYIAPRLGAFAWFAAIYPLTIGEGVYPRLNIPTKYVITGSYLVWGLTVGVLSPALAYFKDKKGA
ncbi:MAG: DUF3796 domain-containing protein [Clostridiales bacterium]|nr:DUF3796 domain-containing protein [Clostridiales bacterium]